MAHREAGGNAVEPCPHRRRTIERGLLAQRDDERLLNQVVDVQPAAEEASKHAADERGVFEVDRIEVEIGRHHEREGRTDLLGHGQGPPRQDVGPVFGEPEPRTTSMPPRASSPSRHPAGASSLIGARNYGLSGWNWPAAKS